jgi:anti-sigma factor RsiW
MRCRDAKIWLTAQREHDLVPSEVTALQEHIKHCSACHTHEQYHKRMEPLHNSSTSRMFTSISTERIMQAVERQKRITEQLEKLRTQQRTRIARLRIFTPRFATLTYLSMGFISILLLTLLIFNTGIVVNILESFGGVIDTLVILTQYLQSGLAFVLNQEWLLSAMALVLVIMMGMWLRLMRHPQEA